MRNFINMVNFWFGFNAADKGKRNVSRLGSTDR